MGKTEWFRGTAEAVYQNLNFVRDTHAELVLILSGDHVLSMDFAPLVEFHRERNADLTIVTAPRPKNVAPSTFGYVTSDPNSHRVSGFFEKPEIPPNDTVSIGIYLFDAKLLCDWLENLQEQSCSHNLPTDVIEPLVHQSLVYAYPFEDDWHYLADLESYVAVHRRMLVEGSKNILRQNRVMTNLRDRELGSRPSPYFGSHCDVQDSLISPGCQVEGTVIRSVLSPGVFVAPNAMITDSILFHDCQVHEGARLHRVVSDKDAIFHSHCQVGTHDSQQCPIKGGLTVVGKGAEIMQGVRVDSGVEIEINQMVKRDLENLVEKNMQLYEETLKKR
jgi:glucose-1-phosphate adenylyltransferase